MVEEARSCQKMDHRSVFSKGVYGLHFHKIEIWGAGMRQGSSIRIVGYLTFFLVLFAATGWVAAAPVTTCNAGTFVVDAGNAASVAQNGYNNPACDLVIQATLPSASLGISLTITAKSVAIDGSLVAGNVEIISLAANSTIRITARVGNISLFEATVKAHKSLNFSCTGPDCQFISDQSEIVTAPDFSNPAAGTTGVLIIDVEGDVNIQNTKVHGQAEWKILSDHGNITIGPCGGGTVGVCTDPLVSKTICFDQQGQFIVGCTPTFNTPDELRSVCYPSTPGEPCNGGFKEKRFEAKKGFIDIQGTTMTSIEHMTFWCGPGGFKGANSNISSKTAEIIINCNFFGGGPVDLEGAQVSAPNGITVNGTSIDACLATFTGDGSPAFPSLNGGSTPFSPFYPATVLYGPFADGPSPDPFDNLTPAANACAGNGARFVTAP